VDTEIVALASTAATTMIGLFATDAWSQAKREISGLWQRFRPEHAAAVDADLVQAHSEAVAAAGRGDEQAINELKTEWESRLKRLAAVDVAVASELIRVVDVLTRTLEHTTAEHGKQPGTVSSSQRAIASGGSSVIQVAGNAKFGDIR
jgi:hypothetical protein